MADPPPVAPTEGTEALQALVTGALGTGPHPLSHGTIHLRAHLQRQWPLQEAQMRLMYRGSELLARRVAQSGKGG